MYLSRSAVVGRPRLGMPSMTALAWMRCPSGRRITCTTEREISLFEVDAKKPTECRLFSTRTRSAGLSSITTTPSRVPCWSVGSFAMFSGTCAVDCCRVAQITTMETMTLRSRLVLNILQGNCFHESTLLLPRTFTTPSMKLHSNFHVPAPRFLSPTLFFHGSTLPNRWFEGLY